MTLFVKSFRLALTLKLRLAVTVPPESYIFNNVFTGTEKVSVPVFAMTRDFPLRRGAIVPVTPFIRMVSPVDNPCATAVMTH